ncbi:UDP-glucose dehydrogenase family protein [Sphingomonas sp.]|uniref:UDP-glucose dehydrogenase family protein n=1 Tax=Sphingomonas sp. TaxID=28214 RepID=UPI003B0052E3
MRIAMIGTGYVGLVSGACFSDFGHEVVCVDKDQGKIDALHRGVMPIFEPGLDALVASNVKAGRLSFTSSLAEGVKGADAVFIAVGTPSRRGDGHADLSYVHAAAEEVARELDKDAVLVTKSTVPVGTGDEVERIVRDAAPDRRITVASNPEFLREGAAIGDFKHPDRVVCGVEDDHAREVLAAIYRPLSLNQSSPVLFTRRRTAELIKYAANAFLATKITFINEIADLCEATGADVQEVSRGIGLDNRIGRKFLHAGPGYGGSCFPKDTLALLQTAEQFDTPLRIVQAVVQVNDHRKRAMGRKVAKAMGDARGKTVAVLGLTFKPNTDDMRDAPSIAIIQHLQDCGASIRACDPEGVEQARKMLTNVDYMDDPYAAAEGADAVVIVTEWDAYRALDLRRIAKATANPLLVDLRNVYSHGDAKAAGLDYIAIGKGEAVA